MRSTCQQRSPEHCCGTLGLLPPRHNCDHMDMWCCSEEFSRVLACLHPRRIAGMGMHSKFGAFWGLHLQLVGMLLLQATLCLVTQKAISAAPQDALSFLTDLSIAAVAPLQQSQQGLETHCDTPAPRAHPARAGCPAQPWLNRPLPAPNGGRRAQPCCYPKVAQGCRCRQHTTPRASLTHAGRRLSFLQQRPTSGLQCSAAEQVGN